MIIVGIHSCSLRSLRSLGHGALICKVCGRGATIVGHKTINMYCGIRKGYQDVHYTRASRKGMRSAGDIIRAKEKKNANMRGWLQRLLTDPCRYCGKYYDNEMTVDHVIPISRGGHTTKENTVSSCKECNRKKAAMTGDEFSEYNKEAKR